MKLILFDFDGVLVDTLGVAFSINKGAKPDLSLEEYKSFFEGNIYDAIASGKKKHIPDFDDQFRLQTRELKIPDELKKMLRDISPKNTLAIVSSASTDLIQEILEREDVANFFADVFGSDVHSSKIVKTKTLLNKYKVEVKDAVFITDTVGDIIEARECGVKAIAVTWGFHDEATLAKAQPVKIVNTPEDLIKAIKE